MSKFSRLAANIPPVYQPQTNRFIRGLLEAWGTGDDAVQTAIEATKDQLFIETASQQYLDSLGSNVGVERPSSVGISDVNFRNLVPAMSFAPKQIRDVIWKLLEIFYQTDAVYANFTSTAPSPYSLTDGDSISFTIDKSKVVVATFDVTDFADITQATALEVANSINKQLVGDGIVATATYDSTAKQYFVQIRTTTAGPQGEVKIAGGAAQNALRFPLSIPTTQNVGTRWDIVFVTGDTIRMEYRAGTNPSLSAVSVGDIVIISGSFVNRGSFVITDVVTGGAVDGITPGHKYTGDYIEFHDIVVTSEDITQTAANDVAFYTPARYDINTYPRPAVMYEINHKEVVVIIPSTAAIIGRNLTGSVHMHPNVGLELLTISDAAGIQFEKNDEIRSCSAMYLTTGAGEFIDGEAITSGPANARILKVIDNDLLDTIILVTDVVGAFIVGAVVTGSASGATRNFTSVVTSTNTTANIDSVLNIDRKMAIKTTGGGFQLNEGVLGRSVFRVSGATAPFQLGETITGAVSLATATVDRLDYFSTDNSTGLLINEVGAFQAGELVTGGISGSTATLERVDSAVGIVEALDIDETYVSPYVYNKAATLMVGAANATLTDDIVAGFPISIINTSDISDDFPTTPGYLIFDYGTSNEEGPVRYIGIPNTNTFMVDPGYLFTKSHAIGSTVRLVPSLEATKPDTSGSDHAAYVTGLAEARTILQAFIRQVIAAGVVIRFVIIYPEYPFYCYNSNL